MCFCPGYQALLTSKSGMASKSSLPDDFLNVIHGNVDATAKREQYQASLQKYGLPSSIDSTATSFHRCYAAHHAVCIEHLCACSNWLCKQLMPHIIHGSVY